MINQLVFTSSYNSQLGCIIAMRQLFKTKKKRNIFVIQLNLSDKNVITPVLKIFIQKIANILIILF